MTARGWKGAWITLAVTALFAALCWRAGGPVDTVDGPIEAWGQRIYDGYFMLRGAEPVPGSVVIVAIDEASIRSEGHWPWPHRDD